MGSNWIGLNFIDLFGSSLLNFRTRLDSIDRLEFNEMK